MINKCTNFLVRWRYRICVALVAFLIFMPASAGALNICADPGGRTLAACERFVNNHLNPVIRIATISIGVIAVLSVIFAGIQYAASADDPEMVTRAKQRIFFTVIGLLAYIFLFALINWLVPGGIFNI